MKPKQKSAHNIPEALTDWMLSPEILELAAGSDVAQQDIVDTLLFVHREELSDESFVMHLPKSHHLTCNQCSKRSNSVNSLTGTIC